MEYSTGGETRLESSALHIVRALEPGWLNPDQSLGTNDNNSFPAC